MGFTGVDDGFELGIGQEAIGDDVAGQMRPVARLGRGDGGHGRRLHQLGRMSLRAGNTDRLQSVFFIKRLGDPAALDRRPVHRLVSQFPSLGLDRARRWHRRRAHGVGADRSREHRACDRGDGNGRDDRQARWDMIGDPAEQRGGVGCDPGRSRKGSRIGGWDLIDHGQPGVGGGAVLGIDGAVDRGREHYTTLLLEPDEGVTPSRIVGCEARSSDGDQTAAIGKARQGRRDMAQRGVRHATVDVGQRRERRVHQHDARQEMRVEVIVNLRRVESGGANVREQPVEQAGAGLGQFVEDKRSAREFGQNGEQAGPGRRFQHAVGWRDRSCRAGGKPQRDRRRELLERLALLGAARMGGEKARDLRQHRQHGGGRCGLNADGRAEFAQEEHRRRLAGVIGGLPVPDAGGVGRSKSRLHRSAENGRVHTQAAFEMGKEKPGGLGDGGGRIGNGGEREGRRRRSGRESGSMCHGETSGELD